MSKTIAELEAELTAARRAEEIAREARRKATKRQWKYTVAPITDSWHRIYDDQVTLYRVIGEVVNRDECAAVGYSDQALGGSMSYLYNSATQCVICSVGGGSIFIPEGNAATFRALGKFLASNPTGGDVTKIISKTSPWN